MYLIEQSNKISKSSAIKLIEEFYNISSVKNNLKVEDFFDKNYPKGYSDILLKIRNNYRTVVPLIENIIENEWFCDGCTVEFYPNTLNKTSPIKLEGAGCITEEGYKHLYNIASRSVSGLKGKKFGVEAIESLYVGIMLGITSIEAFLNLLIFHMEIDLHGNIPAYNKSSGKLLGGYQDWKQLNIEEKIDSFNCYPFNIEILKKSKSFFRDFKEIKKFRNDKLMHLKNVGTAISNNDYIKYLNLFKTGISEVLFQMHYPKNFAVVEKPPVRLLRDKIMPDFELKFYK